MKIYTRTGDNGTTGLIGGTRISKHALRIETYGTVDELNAHIGLIRDQSIPMVYIEQLLVIQDRLFTFGSQLAADPRKSTMKLPDLYDEDVLFLEQCIDAMDEKLPPMKSFVLPGGHTTVSFCHVARCVCRRSERIANQLHEEQTISPLILKYLNRLSDYLFTLSRAISIELNVEEKPWKPKQQ